MRRSVHDLAKLPGMRRALLLPSLAVLCWMALAGRAWGGPPFLTDDPEPTEPGHWEIYGPVIEIDGRGREYAGSAGVELNHGLGPDLQLTLGLPLAFTHDPAGSHMGVGDVEASLKYRIINDEAARFQVAVFPGLTLPTARLGLGAGRVTALVPVWAQKDMGRWSVFGGGGYAINPGAGNRNYWTGGLAVSRQVTGGLLLGAEVDRKSADTQEGHGSTSLGLGAIVKLGGPLRLLASAGPTFDDGETAAGYHAYLALGWNY